MFRCRILGLLGIAASIHSHASATLVEFGWKVSRDGVTWSQNVNALPGDLVYCAAFVRWSNNASDAVGFAGARFNATATNWEPGDQIDFTTAKGSSSDARMSGFDLTSSTQAAFAPASSGGTLRIDDATDTGNLQTLGMACIQAPPPIAGASFHTDNAALLYKFGYHLSVSAAGPRIIVIDTPLGDLLNEQVALYATLASTTPTSFSATRWDPTISVSPTPGAAALLYVAAVGIGRRAARQRPR